MGSRFDTVFKISVILKGLDALVEIIGGVLLLFVTHSEITRLASWLTRNPLAGGSHSHIATIINHSAQQLVHTSTLLGAIYLLSHGVIKMFVIINVLRDKYWAYPLLIVVLLGFSIFQIISIISSHSIAVMLLTAFDIFVMVLTWFEWQRKRKKRAGLSQKEEIPITS
jgi:uncharacterized membrane protein